MVADAVDKGAQPLRLAQTTILAQNSEDPGERLLSHVLDRVRGLQARPKFDPEQLGEVADEVRLRLAVSSPKLFYISCIEGLKMQN
jgi:hypothetical protein